MIIILRDKKRVYNTKRIIFAESYITFTDKGGEYIILKIEDISIIKSS